MVQFRLLGTLQVNSARGEQLDVRGQKLRRLLALFVVRNGQITTIDQVADALWGDQPPASAANALHVLVSKLRRVFAEAEETLPLSTVGQGYVFTADDEDIDARRFERLAAAGHEHLVAHRPDRAAAALREALELWRGPALAEFAFDEFATADRLRLDEMRLACIEDRVDADLQLGRHDAVVAELEGLVAESPLRERMWEQLMLALYRSGRQADALRAFQRARTTLVDEMGIEPRVELRLLEQRMLDHDPSLAVDAPAVALPTRFLTNVRPELSTYVGRVAERAAIIRQLATRRLVTVVGPGGVGKTRLAIETALQRESTWSDAAWIVELGAFSGPQAVDQALAVTFGSELAGAGDRAAPLVDRLAAVLGDLHALIVLDNCEHVVGDSARTAQVLLGSCPNLRILATSRSVLGVQGEAVRQLAPLAIDEAMQLFGSRGSDVRDEFAVDDANSDVVAAICEQVDRLPLGIELAAARLRAFTPEQLSARLDERLSSLGAPTPARVARQQTMQSTVEWSYDLLFEDERTMLRRLSVFPAGFTLDAAGAIGMDDDLDAHEAEEVLGRLVDKSLVVVDAGAGAPRYRLLRTVADFASARAAEAGETAALRERHARWAASLVRDAHVGIRGPAHAQWSARMRAERQNLVTAGDWVCTEGDPMLGLQVGSDIGWFSFSSTSMPGTLDILLRLVERAPNAPAELLVPALAWAGLIGVGNPRAAGLADRAVALATESGDPALIGQALLLSALYLTLRSDQAETAANIVLEGRRCAAEAGDEWFEAVSYWLEGLTKMWSIEDLPEADRLLGEGSLRLRAIGDVRTAVITDIARSQVAEDLGQVAAARSILERCYDLRDEDQSVGAITVAARLAWLACRNGEIARAMELANEVFDATSTRHRLPVRMTAHYIYGVASFVSGSLAEARTHLATALETNDRVGFDRDAVFIHAGLGHLCQVEGDEAAADEHHAAALRFAEQLGLPMPIACAHELAALSLLERGDPQPVLERLALADDVRGRYGLARTPYEARVHAAVLRRLGSPPGAPEPMQITS